MENKKKIFFITSNQSNLDKPISYQIKKYKGNIKIEYRKEITYKNSLFSVYINSFEIEPRVLKDEDQDPKSKEYKIKINLINEGKTFESDTISFRPSKNNFMFNLKFNKYKVFFIDYEPPPQINFSLLEQLKLYETYINNIKDNKKYQNHKDLIIDAQNLCFGRKVYLDFY